MHDFLRSQCDGSVISNADGQLWRDIRFRPLSDPADGAVLIRHDD